MAMAMSTQAKGLLLFLAVVTYASGARGDSHTFVTNQASVAIRATTSYSGGTSQFINRLINPGSKDSDEYSGAISSVHVELWVDGAAQHSSVDIDGDRSLVAEDGSGNGVDIFLVKSGTLVQIDGAALTTIFP